MQDGFGREIEYLRVSVTDRCNLRCKYCMPEEGVAQLSHSECLTLEEIYRLTAILADLGIRKIRLTGGEPMVRKNLVKLVRDLSGLQSIEEVAMTTNGVLLADRVEEFVQAGLTGVNISLDTLDAASFEKITGSADLEKVLLAIERCVSVGLRVKINCVPGRELNEETYLQVAELARKYPVDVRFIEMMPIGCGSSFTRISGKDTLAALEELYGRATLEEYPEIQGAKLPSGAPGTGQKSLLPNGPASYVRFSDFQGRIGFIDPMSHKFCSRCNRIRLTVDGRLKLCLYFADHLDLRKMLRGGASDGEIADAVKEALQRKPQEHFFGEDREQDIRKMVQIGG